MTPCSFTNFFFLLSIKFLSLKVGVVIVSEPTSSRPPGLNHCVCVVQKWGRSVVMRVHRSWDLLSSMDQGSRPGRTTWSWINLTW